MQHDRSLSDMARIAVEWAALRHFGGADFLMVDPPWSFTLRTRKGEAKSAQAKYACQPIDWIKALPMDVLAAENCLCWLWCTNPMLRQGFEVLDAWGFDFRTAGHWVKRTTHGKLAFGTGYLLRCAGEPFLIGVRGKVKTSRSVRSVIEGRIRAHSQKPEEAYREAERLMPDARRVEVFSRMNRPGWRVWGDQTGTLEAAS